jgi:hypothetical protein
MTEDQWRGGLAPHHDHMLTAKPEDPAMRESASIWVYEDNGEFAFPRHGIEGIAKVWENHSYNCNFAFADGRALSEIRTDGKSHSPIDENGQPTILGSGDLQFRCVEPFRKWRATYSGNPVDTTSQAMADNNFDKSRTTPVAYELDLEMVVPAWTQDNTPEALARMSERERSDAGLMGFGFRKEQLFRGKGVLHIDGKSRDFTCSGLRIHRQSVRPMDTFRGHSWQSAVFPDGRAFGYVTYPPAADGSTYNEGYIWQDGKWYEAVATKVPWLNGLVASGEDMSLELTSELGVTRIAGVGGFNTYKTGMAEMPGFALNQGGAKYTWDDQTAYGMVERSSLAASM